MLRPLTPVLWIVAAAALPAAAHAQAPPDRWRTELELGFNGASGNSSFSILRTGVKLRHLATERAEFETSALIRYGRNQERVIADDARASLKLGLWPNQTWSPFVFLDWSRDEIRKLDTRASGGAGGKYTFWAGDRGSASVSAALLFDYQNFRVAAGATDPGSERRARWSVRTKLEKRLSADATFEHVLFYQPVWDRGPDYVVDVTHSVSSRVLGNLSLSVEHQYLHDAVPPPEVKPDDHRFSVLLKLAF